MNEVYNNHCFECGSCVQTCPKGAIRMIENEEGFGYPVINQQSCVGCGLCQKVCPSWHAEELKHSHLKVLAAQVKDRTVLKDSSSGGVFSLIAEFILEQGGVVFGATFDDHLRCHHVCVSDKGGLAWLRGSKYVHSDIGRTYIEAREYLQQDKWVYYTGTPCQIAGLKLFLRKDYPKLLTSDLICHGTPSQKGFNRFVKGMEDDIKERVIGWNFRDKKIAGWACSSSSSSVDSKGQVHYHISSLHMTAYFKAFISGHLFRMDCYQCPFSSPNRVGDITLGDYWGIANVHPEFPDRKCGVSIVVINTKKGLDFWDTNKDKTKWVTSEMDLALHKTNNRNLREPSIFPPERKTAYTKLFHNYSEFCRDYSECYSWYRIHKIYYLTLFKNTKIGKWIYWFFKNKRV